MTCKRCGQHTPRLTLDQRYCPTCEREVRALLAADAQRQAKRTWRAVDLTGRVLL